MSNFAIFLQSFVVGAVVHSLGGSLWPHSLAILAATIGYGIVVRWEAMR